MQPFARVYILTFLDYYSICACHEAGVFFTETMTLSRAMESQFGCCQCCNQNNYLQWKETLRFGIPRRMAYKALHSRKRFLEDMKDNMPEHIYELVTTTPRHFLRDRELCARGEGDYYLIPSDD